MSSQRLDKESSPLEQFSLSLIFYLQTGWGAIDNTVYPQESYLLYLLYACLYLREPLVF